MTLEQLFGFFIAIVFITLIFSLYEYKKRRSAKRKTLRHGELLNIIRRLLEDFEGVKIPMVQNSKQAIEEQELIRKAHTYRSIVLNRCLGVKNRGFIFEECEKLVFEIADKYVSEPIICEKAITFQISFDCLQYQSKVFSRV